MSPGWFLCASGAACLVFRAACCTAWAELVSVLDLTLKRTFSLGVMHVRTESAWLWKVGEMGTAVVVALLGACLEEEGTVPLATQPSVVSGIYDAFYRD